MNTLRTFIVFAILAAVGYGVYATLTHQPPPPPPEIAGQVWGETPNVELPGSPAGMPIGASPTTVEAGGTAPPYNAPMSAAPEAAPVPLEAAPLQQAPGGVGPVAADGYPSQPAVPGSAQSELGAPPYAAGADAQPGYSAPYAAPGDASVSPDAGSAVLHAGDPAAMPAHDPAYGNAAAPPYSAQPSPVNPPVNGPEYSSPPQDPALAAAPGAVPAQSPPVQPANDVSVEAVLAQAQAQLDQGHLADAHLELSRWYQAPQLTPAQQDRVHDLLDRLAGTVVYSQESLLEPPYEVQPGDNLERIAKHYEVPWQLLAKINGITDPQQLRPGETLKVIRGPFNATVDLATFKLTLWLGERYAGSFPIGIGRDQSTPAGTFQVINKVENPPYYGRDAVIQADDPSNPLGERWIDLGNHIGIHGTSETSTIGQAESRGCIRLSERDVEDVYDILGVGSSVLIRR